jgi:hypothetical protein
MPDSKLLVEIDGSPVEEADLKAIAEVQVEEASDQADAAVLTARVEPGADGEWTSLLDPLTAPKTPLAIEVSRGEVSYRFEGLSTEASWELDAEGASRLTVKAVDRSLELDLEEKVVAWSGTSDSGIAEAIFAAAGLSAEVETTPAGPDPDQHVVIQRGTDLAFLRGLAAKHGYALYLEAEDSRMVGHFHPLDPLADPQGELSLGFGGDARKVQAEAELVAGHEVHAAWLPALSTSAQGGDAAGDDQAQGETSLGAQSTVLLAPGDADGEVESLEPATALARRSAFAARLRAEIDAEVSGLMLRARRTVLVKGLGSSLSGRYLVERVRHVVSAEAHRQRLELSRNALGLSGDEPFGGGGLGGLLP